MENKYKLLKDKLHINDKTWGYKLFAIMRTFLLVLVANLLLVTNESQEIPIVLGKIVSRKIFVGTMLSLGNLGWIKQDVIVLCTMMVLLLFIAIQKERGKDIILCMDNMILPVRWGLYYLMIFTILYFGRYGIGYDASNFLYTHF